MDFKRSIKAPSKDSLSPSKCDFHSNSHLPSAKISLKFARDSSYLLRNEQYGIVIIILAVSKILFLFSKFLEEHAERGRVVFIFL